MSDIPDKMKEFFERKKNITNPKDAIKYLDKVMTYLQRAIDTESNSTMKMMGTVYISVLESQKTSLMMSDVLATRLTHIENRITALENKLKEYEFKEAHR